jgi:uncharacterized membrane protein
MKVKNIFLLIGLIMNLLPVAAQTVSGKSNKLYIKVGEGAGENKPAFSFGDIAFTDFNKNRVIDPDEEASINFTIQNVGKATSQNLLIKAYSMNEIKGLIFGNEIKLDSLAPNAIKEISIPIRSSKALESGTANIVVDVRQEFEYDPDQIEINILTEEARR